MFAVVHIVHMIFVLGLISDHGDIAIVFVASFLLCCGCRCSMYVSFSRVQSVIVAYPGHAHFVFP